MKSFVLFLTAFFTLGSISRAQFTQNFEGTAGSLTGNCWSLNGIFQTTDPADVINGNASMNSNPPVNGDGREIITPALNVISTSLNISFMYKISSALSGSATRSIEIGVLDAAGNYTSLHVITMDNSSPVTAQTFNQSFTLGAAGIYKLVLNLGGANGDGSCRLIFDDLSTDANAMYGNGTCNSSPIAVDDLFIGTKGLPLNGNVMANDNEPDGEAMTAAVVANNPDGVLVLLPNGNFIFTPNPSWTGSTTTFTYRLNDHGYAPLNSNTATVTLNFVANSPLPVKLTSFTATLNNAKADLKWTTVSEINLSHFVVEKSTDGTNFSDAAIVFANGNATDKTNYYFSDNLGNSTVKVIYYRLRSVDLDAKSELSDTRIIRVSKPGNADINILAYPNPVVSELRITVPSSLQNKKVVYEVIGANGVVARKKEIASSNQTEILNMNSLSPGLYLVRVSSEGQSEVQKIVKK